MAQQLQPPGNPNDKGIGAGLKSLAQAAPVVWKSVFGKEEGLFRKDGGIAKTAGGARNLIGGTLEKMGDFARAHPRITFLVTLYGTLKGASAILNKYKDKKAEEAFKGEVPPPVAEGQNQYGQTYGAGQDITPMAVSPEQGMRTKMTEQPPEWVQRIEGERAAKQQDFQLTR